MRVILEGEKTMKTQTITGKIELLEALDRLLPTERPFSAKVELGENRRGEHQARENGTATIVLTINGGARDDVWTRPAGGGR